MDGQGYGRVRVIAFGPLAEFLGSRSHKVDLTNGMSIEDVVNELAATKRHRETEMKRAKRYGERQFADSSRRECRKRSIF